MLGSFDRSRSISAEVVVSYYLHMVSRGILYSPASSWVFRRSCGIELLSQDRSWCRSVSKKMWGKIGKDCRLGYVFCFLSEGDKLSLYNEGGDTFAEIMRWLLSHFPTPMPTSKQLSHAQVNFIQQNNVASMRILSKAQSTCFQIYAYYGCLAYLLAFGPFLQ